MELRAVSSALCVFSGSIDESTTLTWSVVRALMSSWTTQDMIMQISCNKRHNRRGRTEELLRERTSSYLLLCPGESPQPPHAHRNVSPGKYSWQRAAKTKLALTLFNVRYWSSHCLYDKHCWDLFIFLPPLSVELLQRNMAVQGECLHLRSPSTAWAAGSAGPCRKGRPDLNSQTAALWWIHWSAL